jgi:hypothetical protein
MVVVSMEPILLGLGAREPGLRRIDANDTLSVYVSDFGYDKFRENFDR